MFYQPASLQEALQLKSQLGSKGRFIAGGTDLVVMMKKGRLVLEDLVDLGGISELRETRDEGDSLFIGATCSHRALETAAVEVLANAARQVGGPQIRNRGTVGGNVGTASPAGDVSVALLALDATVEILSQRGARSLPLREFFRGVGKTALETDELIVGFRFARPAKSAFYKVGKRSAVAISIVSAGASLASDGSICLALGCVAPTPLRLTKTETFLKERGLSEEAIAEASRMAGEEVMPITDHRASAEYRKALAEVLVRRLLTELVEGN